MNEKEWEECNWPPDLVSELTDEDKKWRARKCRLWLCALLRGLEDLLPVELEAPLQVAEWYADGIASDAERMAAQNRAFAQIQTGDSLAGTVATMALLGNDDLSGFMLPRPELREVISPERQANILREIVGNPYAGVIGPFGAFCNLDGTETFQVLWNCDLTPDVRRMAADVYETQNYDLLPVLADALDDAGCKATRLQEHFRQTWSVHYKFAGATGTHSRLATKKQAIDVALGIKRHYLGQGEVTIIGPRHHRGCWALDLLLDK